MTAPGPPSLGRGVVVGPGDPVPAPWQGVDEVVVDEAALDDPSTVVAPLHAAWAGRRPLVVRLVVDAERFRAPVSVSGEPWRLSADHELWLDRLHFLVWANTYDARSGIEPVWWWGRKAARLGGAPGGGAGDGGMGDGAPAWVDGGPRTPFAPQEVGGLGVVHRERVEAGELRPDPPGPAVVTAELAPDQLAAVSHLAGPARIVAPAGSGKTRVLTERLRHLLVDRGWERDGVLAVAYNKRAQLELEERTASFRPRATTLNALGHRLLAEHAGRPPRVLDERDVRRIVDDLVPRRQHRANTDPIAPYLEGLTAIRLGLRNPQEVEAERDDVPGLAGAFAPFRDALRRAGAVDFDDQIYGAVEVLLADGEFRRRQQQAHRHLLVDELQDLTPAHVLLVRLLASPGLEVFGVGDDDQVIYGHAGADPGFLIGFDRLFPGAADHPLEVNYRCPVAVVDAARHLLGYNRRRVAKDIRPGPRADAAADALVVRRHRAEEGASTLVEVVRGWLAAGDVVPADVAVLTRVNSLLLAPHVALVEAGVPVESTLSPDVLQRTGVRAALAYLRLGASPRDLDPNDLQEVVRRPSRGFPQWINKWFSRSMSLDDLRGISNRIDDAKVAAKLDDFAADLERVAAAVRGGGTTRSVLAVIADGVGLAGAMSMLDTSKGGQSGSQLDDLDALAQVADLHPDPATFETWLRTILRRDAGVGSTGEQPAPERQGSGPKGGAAQRGRQQGVTLSTVHRVKGMEWDHVVVAGVTDGILPHRLSEDEEEERRVLHVAITRARRRCVVLADLGRPSPFLGELDGSAPRRAERAKPAPARPSDVTPLPKRTAKPAALGDPSSPEVAVAEEALKAWRNGRARADGMPAYIVASNRLVRAIAEARPATAEELFAVPGMGPAKLDLYGDEILALLDQLD